MKLFALCLFAGGLMTFFAGCAGEGYYTPSQLAAQHSGYDPTPRIYSSTRY